MAHKTLIGGTAYEIKGGRTLVNGTAYEIKSGKTLVGGTAYEVGFGPNYEIFHDFGAVTTVPRFGFNLYTIYNFNVGFEPSECNAIMVNGVMYEVTAATFDNGNFNIHIPGAVSTLTTEVYPYSMAYTASPNQLVIYTYQAGTYEVSLGRVS